MLLSVAPDGEGGEGGHTRQKLDPNFSTFNALFAKITKNIWFVFSDEICVISFY